MKIRLSTSDSLKNLIVKGPYGLKLALWNKFSHSTRPSGPQGPEAVPQVKRSFSKAATFALCSMLAPLSGKAYLTGALCSILISLCAMLFALCSSFSVAWAATYYVDATNGNYDNDGLSTSTAWKTVNKVNNSNFKPGDFILFKRGETWREQLTVPSSGSAGSVITFGAYGTGAAPIIDASDIITPGTSWTKDVVGGDIWTATVTTEPKIVFFDGVIGTKVASQAACTGEGKWFWEADVLYVYSATDADTAYTSPGIEIAQRDNAIQGSSRSYITYDGLNLTKTNAYGLNLNSTTNVTLQNSEISYVSSFGLLIGTASSDLLIEGNNIHHNGFGGGYGCGIWTWEDAATSGHEVVIRGNTVANSYSYGMVINSNYYIIENNVVSNNGDVDAPYGANGIEIVNLGQNGFAQHIIIRYNTVYGQVSGINDGTGIAADDYSRYVDIYGNLTYGNDGPGIGAWKAKDVNIYNNSIYGNMLDSSATHTTGGEISIGSNAADVSNIVIKNNIGQATGETYPAIRVDSNAYGSSGLSITNNIWYAAATNWYFWNATAGSNLATWNALTGIGMDINSNPSMTDPENKDFTLQSSSPAINAGVDVGLKRDFVGNVVPFGAFPDIGAYEKRSTPTGGGTSKPSSPLNFRIN